MRKRLNDREAEFLGLQLRKHDKGRKTARYTIDEEQFSEVLKLRITPNKRMFVETIKKLDKDGEIVSTTEKLQSKPIDIPDNFEVVKISTSKTTGQQWIQYKPKEEVAEVKDFDFNSIIKKHIKRVKLKPNKLKTDFDFDTLTYTDLHVAMDTNSNGNSMYADLWNREEVLKTAKLMIDKTLEIRESNKLIVDELGDLLDGYNGFTTRGGHKLPQNMNNEQAFDCALEFKMMLLDGLVEDFKEITFNNICNDNHAGSFGYFVNQAFKQIAELKYKNVTVNNPREFLSHYFVNDICFVITHGKDDSTLKFGFKPHLDAKQIEKIDQYLKRNNIYGNCKRIIFKKGDSHQLLFDMCGSDDFDYYNYLASSPSSQWVQSNFKKGRRGFVIENFKGITNTITPIFIDKL